MRFGQGRGRSCAVLGTTSSRAGSMAEPPGVLGQGNRSAHGFQKDKDQLISTPLPCTQRAVVRHGHITMIYRSSRWSPATAWPGSRRSSSPAEAAAAPPQLPLSPSDPTFLLPRLIRSGHPLFRAASRAPVGRCRSSHGSTYCTPCLPVTALPGNPNLHLESSGCLPAPLRVGTALSCSRAVADGWAAAKRGTDSQNPCRGSGGISPHPRGRQREQSSPGPSLHGCQPQEKRASFPGRLIRHCSTAVVLIKQSQLLLLDALLLKLPGNSLFRLPHLSVCSLALQAGAGRTKPSPGAEAAPQGHQGAGPPPTKGCPQPAASGTGDFWAQGGHQEPDPWLHLTARGSRSEEHEIPSAIPSSLTADEEINCQSGSFKDSG